MNEERDITQFWLRVIASQIVVTLNYLPNSLIQLNQNKNQTISLKKSYENELITLIKYLLLKICVLTPNILIYKKTTLINYYII